MGLVWVLLARTKRKEALFQKGLVLSDNRFWGGGGGVPMDTSHLEVSLKTQYPTPKGCKIDPKCPSSGEGVGLGSHCRAAA